MPEYLNPDFDNRVKFIQPQTQIFRAPYRSPINSEELNLFGNSLVEDLNYLYSKLEVLQADFNSKLEDLYENGGIQISVDIILKTLHEYAIELQYIREEIENLK